MLKKKWIITQLAINMHYEHLPFKNLKIQTTAPKPGKREGGEGKAKIATHAC